MQAIRQIKKPHGNKITIDIPPTFKSGMVEVIILPVEGAAGTTRGSLKKKALLSCLDDLQTKKMKKRSKRDIDSQIAAQRDSWV